MRTVELIGDIDGQHRLHARVPTEIPAGQVRVMVFLPEEDEAGRLWANGVAFEWSADLADPREDIYSLDDDHRVNAGSELVKVHDGQAPHAINSSLGMSTNVKMEIDEQTADVLHARAAELGVTVSELVAELATLDSEPIAVDSDEIAELDRRWKKIEAGQPTVPHERVVRWLRTWGTPRFRRWQDQ